MVVPVSIESGTDGMLLCTFLRRRGLQTTWLRGSIQDPTGCNLFRDAAACASRERSVRARPLSVWVSAVLLHAGGGRCLRRSRAPRARRGRRQRVQDAHGVCCGRCGGGSGLVSGSYSDFRVGKFSFAF